MFDMSDLKRIEPMGQLAPEAMAGFTALGQAALAEGAIPKKYKESMAIAVALTTQCPYCIQIHREAALAAGATNVELAERPIPPLLSNKYRYGRGSPEW